MNAKALRHAISNVGILRPDDAHELYLKIDVFDSSEMSAKLGTIDLSSSSDWEYFEALLVNNGENRADLTVDPLRAEYFPGTQWIRPADMDTAIKKYGTPTGFRGYGPAFNNSPVNIGLLAWLEAKDLASNLDRWSRFYLRFVWYYLDYSETEPEEHFSDHFSMVVPSYAEVGAKAGAAVTKSEIYDIKQALETQVTTAHFMDDDEIEEITGSISPDDPRYGLVDYDQPGFYVEPYQCTILEDFSTSVKNIILQGYAEGKTYKLKFRTGSSAVTVGTRASATTIAFNANLGNGSERIDELSSSSTTFAANTTYLIAVNLGMIQVIAQN